MTVKTKIIGNLDGSLTIASGQDDKIIKNIADLNKREKFQSRHGTYKGDSKFGHHVARIPLIVLEQLIRDGIWGDKDRMKEWLNKREVQESWRTTKGKL
jgi:hypothetical protein